MTRFYRLDEADTQLAELEPILSALRYQRIELIRLRDIVLESDTDGPVSAEAPGPVSGRPEHATAEPDLRLVRLRMQGLIDQMQAGVARIDELGVVLRDISTGLIDFPALVNGRQICLCWRLGEEAVDWWHELETGFAGRKPLIELT